MRYAVLGAVFTLALAPAVPALDDKPKPGTPAAELKALLDEQAALTKARTEALKASKKEDLPAVLKGFTTKMLAMPARFLELAKKYPDDPVAPAALARVLASRRQPEAGEALEIIKKNHMLSPGVGAVCETMAFASDADSEKFLREVLTKNQHADAQGQAAFALATMLKNRTQRRGIEEKEILTLNKEAEELFDRVATKHATVKTMTGDTLGDRVKPVLFELRHLVVGKASPDIEGEDIDGKKFKLSDYRGKVVLLDFWGHW